MNKQEQVRLSIKTFSYRDKVRIEFIDEAKNELMSRIDFSAREARGFAALVLNNALAAEDERAGLPPSDEVKGPRSIGK